MPNVVLADNAYATLAFGISTTDSSLILTSGHGARFPAITPNSVLYCCLVNNSNTIEEIQITTHTAGSDNFGIVRAAGGSTAKVWSAGDRIEARISKTSINSLLQAMSIKLNIFKYLTDAQIADVLAYTGLIDVSAAIRQADADAYNSGAGPQRTIFFPAGAYNIASTIDMHCEIEGEGPYENNTGTVFKWVGSDPVVFNFPTYVTGWLFKKFRIDLSNVTTDTVGMKFSFGLTFATFSDVEVKAYHTGGSWGGTYANHDGILVVGGSGATKYDFANCTFDHVVFLRCRIGVYGDGDPGNGGPGSSLVFRNCFGWTSGPVIRLFGANNILENFEIAVEAGTNSVIQTGPYATNWVYIACDFNTAGTAAGDQPIYVDYSQAANFATFIGGTLASAADASGVPSLVYDVGATNGKTQRYLVYGMNNVDISTRLSADEGAFYSGIQCSRNLTAGGSVNLSEGLSGCPVTGSSGYGTFRTLQSTLNNQISGCTAATFTGGLYMVTNHTDSTFAIFVAVGTATSIMISSGANWSTTYNAATKEGIAYDGSNGPLLFSNRSGAKTYSIFCIGGF